MAKAKEENVEVLTPEVVEEINTSISNELTNGNITDLVINELHERYGSLTINGQSDKKGYLEVQEARKDVKRVRVLIKKICEKGREQANAEAAMWIAKQKELIGRVSPLEESLEKQETDWEAEKERLEAERKQLLEERYTGRIQELTGFGGELRAGNWVLGELSYEWQLVKEGDEDIYAEIRDGFRAIWNVEEQKREAQRLKDEKERKEMEEFRRNKRAFRIDILRTIGVDVTSDGFAKGPGIHMIPSQLDPILSAESDDWNWHVESLKGTIAHFNEEEEKRKKKLEKDRDDELRVHNRLGQIKKGWWNGLVCNPDWDLNETLFTKKELIELSDEEFEERRDRHNKVVDQREAEEARKKEEKRQQEIKDAEDKARGQERRKMMQAINGDVGSSDLFIGQIPEEQWQTDYETAKKLHDQRKAQREKDQKEKEMAEASDKERYQEIVAYLKKCPDYPMKSGAYRSKAKTIRDFIAEL